MTNVAKLDDYDRSAPSLSEDGRWHRRVLWLMFTLLVVRVSYLAILPLGLCADEAYYWDWSRQLDWGYFSKPPLIAWIIAASTFFFGQHEFAIRLPATLLATLGIWPIYQLGSRMFSARVGFWSALAVTLTPGVTAMSLLMTIDAPFLCAWSWALWLVWQLVHVEQGRWKWVLAATVVTGLGLLSKQTMLAIFPLTAMWMLVRPQEQRGHGWVAYGLWTVGSLLSLIPVLWWNSRHDWTTFLHTTEHFQSQPADWGRRWVWFLEFWVSELGVVSPIVALGTVWVCLTAVRMRPIIDRRLQFCFIFGVLPLIAISGLALTRRVQPNWPAGFVLPCVILWVAWGCRALELPGLPRRCRAWRNRGVVLAGVASLILLVSPLVLPTSSWAGSSWDATTRLRGWKELSQAIGDSLLELFPNGERPLVIAATGRGPVSLLAYYLPGQPRVFRWNPARIADSQHEIWGGPGPEYENLSALIVAPEGYDLPVDFRQHFSEIRRQDICRVPLGNGRFEELRLWTGQNYTSQVTVNHRTRVSHFKNSRISQTGELDKMTRSAMSPPSTLPSLISSPSISSSLSLPPWTSPQVVPARHPELSAHHEPRTGLR